MSRQLYVIVCALCRTRRRRINLPCPDCGHTAWIPQSRVDDTVIDDIRQSIAALSTSQPLTVTGQRK